MSYRQGADPLNQDWPSDGARLVVQQGRRQGQEVDLGRSGSFLVGRAAGCDIVLDDAQVARRHAHFYWRGLQLMVEGLGAGPGIRVNGLAVIEPQALRPGDRVQLGDCTLTVEALPGTRQRPARESSLPYYQPAQLPRPRRGRTRWLIISAVALLGAVVLGGLTLVTLWYFDQKTMTRQPVVSLYQPAAGSQVVAGSPVTVQATAIDETGIARMELWVNGVLAERQTSPSAQGESPFLADFSWVPPTAGSHTLEIRAYNIHDLSGIPITVVVNTISPTTTPTPQPTATATPQPTATPSPLPTLTFTPLPTLTPTQTPVPVPEMLALLVVNVRAGPGVHYPAIGQLLLGDTARVVGRNTEGTWWQIIYPPDSDSTGWVAGLLIQINEEALRVPVVTPAPVEVTPTAEPEGG